jgi:Asparagine synthase
VQSVSQRATTVFRDFEGAFREGFKCTFAYWKLQPNKLTESHHALLEQIDLFSASKADLEKLLGFAGLDFLIVAIPESRNRVLILRGTPASEEIFYSSSSKEIVFRRSLKTLQADAIKLSFEGMKNFLSSSFLFGVCDLDFSGTTLISDWLAIPPLSAVEFDLQNDRETNSVTKFDNVWSGVSTGTCSQVQAAKQCRDILFSEIHDLVKTGYVSTEFSGGIDSGLVTAVVKAVQGDTFSGAFSINYPFFEFSRERVIREQCAGFIGINPRQLDWAACLPFSELATIPFSNLPSLASGSWSFFNQSVGAGLALRSTTHLTGHGGDRLFGINPGRRYEAPPDWKLPSWVSKELVNSIASANTSNIRQLTFRNTGVVGEEWSPGFFEPPWAGRQFGDAGIRYKSGFSSINFIRALREVWGYVQLTPNLSPKFVAELIFSDLLPTCVWHRTGKVDHLGAAYRGVLLNAKSITQLVTRHSYILDGLGIKESSFLTHCNEICKGLEAPNSFFGAIIAMMSWLESCSHSKRFGS